MRPMRTLGVGLAAACGGALLAACGSSSPSASSSTTTSTTVPGHRTTTTTAPATTTTAPATTTTSAPATTTTAKPGSTICQVSQLSIAVSGSSGAAGSLYSTFSLTNSSPATCTLYGYPGMLLLSASGQALATNVVRSTQWEGTQITPTTVTLAPGQAAWFNTLTSDVTQATTTCSQAAQVEVTPPTNTTHAVVTDRMRVCDNGRINVSAVFGATDSAATRTTQPPPG